MYIYIYNIFCSKQQATSFNHVYGWRDLPDPGFLCFSNLNKTLMLGHTWYTTCGSIKLCHGPTPMVDFRLLKYQTQCVKTYWTGHSNHVWSFKRYNIHIQDHNMYILYIHIVYRYFVFRVCIRMCIYIWYICIYIQYIVYSIYYIYSIYIYIYNYYYYYTHTHIYIYT